MELSYQIDQKIKEVKKWAMIKIYDALIFVGQSLSNAICSLEHYLLKYVKQRVSGHVSELYN